jgi:H+/Cl- antiporter ClcA
MTSAQQVTGSRGRGWLIYSAIMLLIVGLKLILDGLWALDRSDTVVDELHYEADLGTWGWIVLITGILVFAAGIAVFYRKTWAQVVGIAAATVAIIANFMWLFAYPVSALVGIMLASLVIYGLAVYGGKELEF